jgi:UDP-2,3-diacylglucosamine pyrophosphatase LpxH
MASNAFYRSVFISDVHLGSSDCQGELLLEFLSQTDCEFLYLVGDIFDLWKIKHAWTWPEANDRLLKCVFDKARQGTRVVYVPGNHDELIRGYLDNAINGVEVTEEVIHTTAAGKALLVLHGDIFDELIRNMDWLENFADNMYTFIMFLNRLYNRSRRLFGYNYWSFATFIKVQFKEARKYIQKFEQTAIQEAQSRQVDGVVCGHIHVPNLIEQDEITYFNTGDWVEHCSALVEDQQGEMRLLYWLKEREMIAAEEERRNEKVLVNF